MWSRRPRVGRIASFIFLPHVHLPARPRQLSSFSPLVPPINIYLQQPWLPFPIQAPGLAFRGEFTILFVSVPYPSCTAVSSKKSAQVSEVIAFTYY